MNMREPERRNHQVLLSFERPVSRRDFPSRLKRSKSRGRSAETGEIGVEGIGALDLIADEKSGEAHGCARIQCGLAGSRARAASRRFRYHARAQSGEHRRRCEALRGNPTLAAIAERARPHLL